MILRLIVSVTLLIGGFIWLIEHWNGEDILLALLFFGISVVLLEESP